MAKELVENLRERYKRSRERRTGKEKCNILPMDYKIIKERRALLGLTQQDLSDYTGLSVRFIKSIEAGKGNPSVETLSKITEVLGLEIVMKVKEINV